MDYPIKELSPSDLPPLFSEIPQPPRQLNYRGALPPAGMKLLAVVGSRQYTNYGKDAVEYLIGGLRGYNIGIVSGLALGIDSLAHEAALRHGLYTLAIPGGGLAPAAIYPRSHKGLAEKILSAGGGLLSEYEPEFRAAKWSFPQRNRLVAGIGSGTLVIEAGEKSGSLITARLTADYNRELMVVPGNIFSDNSKGVHQFLKLGATPVTEPDDILQALGMEVFDPGPSPLVPAFSPEEELVIKILTEPTERDTLIRKTQLPVEVASIILMRLEMNGQISESAGIYRKA